MREKLIRHLVRYLVVLLGGAIGAGVAALVIRGWELLIIWGVMLPSPTQGGQLTVYMAFIALSVLVTLAFSAGITQAVMRIMRRIEQRLEEIPMPQVVTGTLGLIGGLIIAALMSQLFNYGEPTVFKTAMAVLLYVIFGQIGLQVSIKRWRELPGTHFVSRRESKRRGEAPVAKVPRKILDTSVIIDGRIFDICKTGFIDGTLVVPQFVLAELRHIADSSDALRRNRGRRGLDVLQRIQRELEIRVEIEEADFEDEEVDVKLLKLAQETGDVVVTNDYNLNKVASVTGVKVLNINELANAVKPVVLHGEEMVVQIVREGKEPGQGVGYLEDGTMIVVDNGRRCVGETVEVIVTTVLQTAAGRMIFTKLKQMDKVG